MKDVNSLILFAFLFVEMCEIDFLHANLIKKRERETD